MREILNVPTGSGRLQCCQWVRLCSASLLLLLCLALAIPAAAAPSTPELPYQDFFPTADRIDALAGDPLAAPVFHGEVLLGYMLLTDRILPIPAYSGHPITTAVGLNLSGRIVGVRILRHQEPILAVGITEQRLSSYVAQFKGLSAYDKVQVDAKRKGYVKVDGISGATISVMVLSASIMRSVEKVATSRHLQPGRMASTAEPAPIWVQVWRDKQVQIAVLSTALLLLTLILTFQDWLARHPSFLIYVRDGYLVFTLFFIGWYALAQLSVVNVLTFSHAVLRDFEWNSFLIDPLMFILWSFVAMTLLLWGRGVYCGWLCPFGALQELVNQAARRLKIKQWEFPQAVHERLWAVKYLILLALFGLSLQSLDSAIQYIEVEPFKTAITLRFQREWSYLIYALALVAISMVNRKFYCKYLCPLGAALAIPARLRLFDWLRRCKECGHPCQICAKECEVQAINHIGVINANECHYCLDCQTTFYNDRKCPPMVDKRKRRARGARARELIKGMEGAMGESGRAEIPIGDISRPARKPIT